MIYIKETSLNKLLGISVIFFAFNIIPAPAFSAPDANRLKALNILWKAYSQYQQGMVTEGEKGVQKALSIDPDLAYANIVKAEFAMKSHRWRTAKKYFERGLSLLEQPDQPVSPNKSAQISSQGIEADSRCFLGYVYIKLAQQASRQGNANIEQKYLAQADKFLRAGIELGPGDEARELAQNLLKIFRGADMAMFEKKTGILTVKFYGDPQNTVAEDEVSVEYTGDMQDSQWVAANLWKYACKVLYNLGNDPAADMLRTILIRKIASGLKKSDDVLHGDNYSLKKISGRLDKKYVKICQAIFYEKSQPKTKFSFGGESYYAPMSVMAFLQYIIDTLPKDNLSQVSELLQGFLQLLNSGKMPYK